MSGLMPDAEDPAPPKVEEHDQPTDKTHISTDEFHERADAYLGDVVERLEEAQEKDPQIEVDYSVRAAAPKHCALLLTTQRLAYSK
jgi:frataxin